MKRALLLLVGLLVAVAPAQAAKVLILERNLTTTGAQGFSPELNRARSSAMLTGLLDLTGADYRWGPSNTIKTEWARTGVVPAVLGGDRVETFGGVINWNFSIGTTGWRNTAYRPDSLLSCAKSLLVPHLFASTNYWALEANAAGIGLSGSSVCTTGVASGATMTNGQQPFLHVPGSETVSWYPGSYVTGWEMSSYEPRGGRRIMLKGKTGRPDIDLGTPCIDCDSLVADGSEDTASVWMLPRAEVSGSSPAIMAHVAGIGAVFDSATGSAYTYCENDPLLMLFALAVLDSQMAGGLFDASHLPIKIGVTIDGGFRHQSRASYNGAFAPDSAAIKVSAAALAHIPAVLGVNVDSVNAYPYEKAWWARWSSLRYTPQSWARVEDSTGVAGRDTAGVLHLEDVMGRLRKRTAYGPAYTSGADTSVYALLKYARDRLAALFPGKTSTTLLAPLDDLLPANHGGKADSVLYAAVQAGFTTVRVDGHSARRLPSHEANPIGGVREQGRHRVLGADVNLLAHNGYSQAGGQQQMLFIRIDSGDATPTPLPLERDTTFAGADIANSHGYPVSLLSQETGRVQDGLLGRALDYDQRNLVRHTTTTGYAGKKISMDDYQTRYRGRASLIRLCANDFSGDPSGPPAKNGYWLLKNLDNAFALINAAAGRTVITWAYPEDIQP